jgi:hypothetical protein
VAEGKDYGILEEDVRGRGDGFLGRRGPETFEFPWSRDKYYEVDAYVPGRKWVERTEGEGEGEGGQGGKWWYFDPGKVHGNDVGWVVARFGHVIEEEKKEAQRERCAGSREGR